MLCTTFGGGGIPVQKCKFTKFFLTDEIFFQLVTVCEGRRARTKPQGGDVAGLLWTYYGEGAVSGELDDAAAVGLAR